MVARLELQEFMNHCTNLIKEIKLGRILMSFSLLRIHDHKMTITSAGMPPVYFYDLAGEILRKPAAPRFFGLRLKSDRKLTGIEPQQASKVRASL